MSRSWIRLNTTTTTTSLLLVFLFLFVYVQSIGDDSADSVTPFLRSTIVLPLTLSAPDSSRALFHYRRHLQISESYSNSTARMRLYDGLIRQGYYSARIWIGTPAQRFALVVDTGSVLTFVPCSTCKHCGIHQHPKFEANRSRTYRPLKCGKDCTCDSEMKHCVYDRYFTEMSSSSGVLGEDFVSFGDQSELKPQRIVFGCENAETGPLHNQLADGVMGLGRGDHSIVDQLVHRGVISNSFSLCYGGMVVGGGAMVLGGISPPADMLFAHSDPARSPYYNIDLKEIHVAGKRLPLNPSVFDGKFGTILDSGATCAYLPEAAFKAFKDAIMTEVNFLNTIDGPNSSFEDICFAGVEGDVSQLSNVFPAVDMVFSNGNKLSLSPENYLFRHFYEDGAYCLGIYRNEIDDSTRLGGIIVRNTLVMYDREHLKIGFWKTDCARLWEIFHLPNSSAAEPLLAIRENSTEEIMPTLAPRGPPLYTVPAEVMIGLITFDMRLSIVPPGVNLTELDVYVAHGLDVDTSQVRLLNTTSEDGHFVLTWAINPVKNSGHISRAAAKNILARIVEHRVSLPPMFGNYQVFDWRFWPPAEREWWEEHHSAVVMSVVLTLLVGHIAAIMWFTWRNRGRSFRSYRPVRHVFPEHELQPLGNFQGAVTRWFILQSFCSIPLLPHT